MIHSVSVDSLLEPRKPLVDTHLTSFLLGSTLSTFRRRKTRRSTKGRAAAIGLGFPDRLSPDQTLKFVEVCARVHANVHFHETGLRFESEVDRTCAIAIIVGLTAVAVGVLQEVDLLELAWCDIDVVFCNDWVVVLDVCCS